MKLSLILLACVAIVAADYVNQKTAVKIADKEFLLKQKFILDMLHHVHQPLQNEEYWKDGHRFVEGESNYKNYARVIDFFEFNKQGMLPQGHIFSILNEVHLKQTVALFKLFYYSKDWTTFYKNVVCARMNLNEGMFVYALSVAVAHMDELTGIILPARYEINPFLFYNGEVMSDAASWMMQGKHLKRDKYYINTNYTCDYNIMNDESQLAYFTEDIGLNSYYYNFHIDYPFWMGGKDLNLNKDRRGELYLYMHQQLLARYYLERLSNGLGDIPEFSWYRPIKTGYNPMMRYHNGIGFSYRKNYYEVDTNQDYHLLNRIQDYERRIRDVIDSGFVTLRDGTKLDMRKQDSIDILGNLIQSNPDSHNNQFFGYLTIFSRWLLGGANYKYVTDYKIVPSVLEHFETALRDPVFYQLYKRIVKHYFQLKDNLPSYKREELMFHGVKIQNINVGKLVTYFDNFDSDITTAVDLNLRNTDNNNMYGDDTNTFRGKNYQKQDFTIFARQMRLNHKPFSVSMDVMSDKSQKVVIRLFMGPKHDQYGNVYDNINENRDNFVEIDQFVYELPNGMHTIVRESKDFYFTVKDRTTYSELYKRVMMAIDGNNQFPLDMSEAHCGFPDRLLLPKGRTDGMQMQFFVIINQHNDNGVKQFSTYDNTLSCGVGSGSRYIDNLSLGYPFDRQIDETNFNTPNMFFKDVFIYHNKLDRRNMNMNTNMHMNVDTKFNEENY